MKLKYQFFLITLFKEITIYMYIMKIYKLIDKNNLVNTLMTSDYIEDVFHEMLIYINDYLLMLLTNNLSSKISLDSLNFDNLQCVEVLKTKANKKRDFILNVYKFDINSLKFYDSNDKIKNVSEMLNYIISNITQNKKKFENKDNKLQSDNKNSKPKGTVKKILEETKTLISPKTEQTNQCKQIEQKEVKLPMNSLVVKKPNKNNNITVDDDSDDDSDLDEIDEEVLKRTIDELKKAKNAELDKIKQLEKIKDEVKDEFTNVCNEVGDIKRELRKTEEKYEELKARFYANKAAYLKMKDDISKNKFSEEKIPDFFAQHYVIYKFMDQKNLLDSADEYMTFLNIYDSYCNKEKNNDDDQKKSSYVPHNVHYLNDDAQQKYANNKIQNKNMIEEFLNKYKPKKEIPSMEDVLKSIDDDTINEDTEDDNLINDNVTFE